MQEVIINIMNNFGYIGISLLIFLENVFPPIPSEVILTFGGFMTTYSHINIVGVIIASTIGSVLGAIVLYYIGRILNEERLEKLINSKVGKVLHFKMSDIKSAEKWFNSKGITTVFFCRFIPVVRSLISIPAGISKMRLTPFIIYTTLGSLIWNSVLAILGKLAGSHWENIVTYVSNYSKVGVIVLSIVFIIFVIYFMIKKKKN